MPVKGLSDVLRLPRLGKIRLGEKRISSKGNEYPAALDYFVVPDEVKKIYGEKPRELDVMAPVEDPSLFFPVFYKRYGKSKGLICKGDGEQATVFDEATNMMEEIPCHGKDCPFFIEKKCKAIGNLQLILYKVPGLGIYQIDTSSFNSIVNINSAIAIIRHPKMVGRIAMVPLILRVEMQEAHPMVNGKKISSTIPVMSLDCNYSVGELITQSPAKKLIPGPLGEAEKVEIDNPQVDEKEDLLYPETEAGEAREDSALDKQIEGAFKILGYSKARRKGLEYSFPDKEKLLKKLNSEIDKAAEGRTGGESPKTKYQKPGPSPTSRVNKPAVQRPLF